MKTKRIAIMFAALALVLAMAGVSWAVTDIIDTNQTKTYEYSKPRNIVYKITASPTSSGVVNVAVIYARQPGEPLSAYCSDNLPPGESRERNENNVIKITFEVLVGPMTVSIRP